MNPQWSLLAEQLRFLTGAVADETVVQVHLDQHGATMRDVLDRYGISLHDTDALFAGLVFQQQFVNQLTIAAASGQIPIHVAILAQGMWNGNAAALLPYLPEQVRR